MLQLKNIKKIYGSGDTAVQALNGVSLAFRHNEFVSILGQSGCGKTTLLNLVGGLDHYDDGDLIINGKSTKHFKDRDWDTYRNHTIGFVFQSYNLIPHQSVLSNVELALTLSGVSKADRRRRAKAALEQVGLSGQMRKKPSQLSGGQMQRVAIARALVNDPDIILADEPTGALDTETSVQVMDILKEVASDRLVVMVTHNPELAEQYSTRIIKMLDGKIIDDSAPLTEEEIKAEQALEREKTKPVGKKRREKKPSMSFATSFGLSLKNLFTKKGRTTLTAFAGSIGIIGIALIAAVSNGTTTYIDTVQEDTLSSYPLTLEATHTDMGSLLETFMGTAMSAGDHELDAVYQKNILYNLVNSMSNMQTNENDLKAFKKFLEKTMADKSEGNALRDAINGIQYGYDLNLLIYTKPTNEKDPIRISDSEKLLMDLMVEHLGVNMTGMKEMGDSYGFTGMMSNASLWQEMLPGNNGELLNPLIYEQYELIDGGRWPSAYNEIVLVVDQNNELDDMTLYAMGLKSEEEMDALSKASLDHVEIEIPEQSWSYEEIRALEFRTVLPFDCYAQYTKGEKKGLYYDMRYTEDGEPNNDNLGALYMNGLPLKVTGIIRLKEEAQAGMLTGKICYTSDLTKYVIQQAAESQVVKDQLANPDIDIFTGKPFKPETTTITAETFAAYLRDLDDTTKVQMWKAFMSDPSASLNVENYRKELLKTAKEDEIATINKMTEEELKDHFLNELAAPAMEPTAVVQKALKASGMPEKQIQAYLATLNAEQRETEALSIMTQTVTGAIAQLNSAGGKTQTQPSEKTLEMTAEEIKDGYRSLILPSVIEAYGKDTREAYAKKSDADIIAELNTAVLPSDNEAQQPWLTDSQRMTLYKTAEFIGYVGKLDSLGQANTYVDIQVADQNTSIINLIQIAPKETLLKQIGQMTAGQQTGSVDIQNYLNSLSDEELRHRYAEAIRNNTMGTAEQTRRGIEALLRQQGLTTDKAKAEALKTQMQGYTATQFADYYENVLDFAETTYDENLVTLGKLDLDSPATINIYASSFENKDVIEQAILDYNEGKDELQQIVYTDYVGLIMSSVTTIIDAITYVLIAFVSISLIVSSIMIGVITLISVQERTKEIGILRAIGASKRNVSSMFNAETMIIGFTAGVIGVGITYLLCLPINAILNYVTDIPNLKAALPIEAALILVGISVLLTLFAGIIPSRSAAKKDPVVALRTE